MHNSQSLVPSHEKRIIVGSLRNLNLVTDVTHQLKYLTLNVFMTNSCFGWNCDTLTLNSIEVKEVNLLHFGAPTNPFPTCNAEFFLLLSAPFSIVSVFQFLERKEINPHFPSLFWTKKKTDSLFPSFFLQNDRFNCKVKTLFSSFVMAKPASTFQRFDYTETTSTTLRFFSPLPLLHWREC